MVPEDGFEPSWPCGRGILSPLRIFNNQNLIKNIGTMRVYMDSFPPILVEKVVEDERLTATNRFAI